MPIQTLRKNAWKVLSLLVLIHCGQGAGDKADDYQEAGQAYFFDGTAECSGSGYGITVDEFYMECDHQDGDSPCAFDQYFKVMGQSKFPVVLCYFLSNSRGC